MLHRKSPSSRPLHVLKVQAYVSLNVSINVTTFTHIKVNHKHLWTRNVSLVYAEKLIAS